MANKFVDTMFENASFTLTENGAKTYVTTNSAIVDQFGKAGNYRGRDIHDVFEDQKVLWDENEELALRFPFYLRMVTRKVKVNKNTETEKVQNGQGARDEAFKRLLWIAKNHEETFNKNIWILPLVGSWKDIWTLMYYDLSFGVNAINHEDMFDIIKHGLSCETHVDLVKKFMPRIKSNKKCTTDWTMTTNKLAKEFAKYVGITFVEYNLMKTTGTAHDFQKIICAREYDKLNWNLIPGRALNLLVSGKFLDNHNLTDSYVNWIESQPVAKFTGYVYELGKKYREALGGYYRFGPKTNVPIALKYTLNAQFKNLVETARKNGNITENVLCALDTSSSMDTAVKGLTGINCSDIANSLAIFFSELNTGAFHNKIMMFDDKSYPYDFKKDTFCDKIKELPGVPCGGTNFQSVVDEMVKLRLEHPEIPLEEWPTTLLVVSDMQFNPANNNWRSVRHQVTNYEYSVNTLKEVFPEEFVDNMKFVWWDCAARYGNTDYEANKDTEGAYFFSGFDGSVLSLLLNEEVVENEKVERKKMTAAEMVQKALSQEILNFVEV